MEDYLKSKVFEIQERYSQQKTNELLLKFNSTPGIEEVNCVKQSISVVYNPYQISEQGVSNLLLNLGLTVKKSEKKSFKNTLRKMAEENRINFGNKRLDCCDLNN